MLSTTLLINKMSPYQTILTSALVILSAVALALAVAMPRDVNIRRTIDIADGPGSDGET